MKKSDILNTNNKLTRGSFLKGVGASIPLAALSTNAFSQGLFGAFGTGARNSGRSRRLLAVGHAVVAYRTATAAQKEEAEANAEKAMPIYQKRLEKMGVSSNSSSSGSSGSSATNGSSGSSDSDGSSGSNTASSAASSPLASTAETPSGTSMLEKPNSTNASPLQAVPVTPESDDAKAAVMVVDLETGGIAGNGVVEMSQVPKSGMNVTDHVEAAVDDGTITQEPSEFLETDVVVASL